jgi:hypothetical protein
MEIHTYKPRTWEGEAGGRWAGGQPGLHSKTLSQTKTKTKKETKEYTSTIIIVLNDNKLKCCWDVQISREV